MSVPTLRQPKISKQEQLAKKSFEDLKFIILTLKNDKKLVVSAEAYNGIINDGELLKKCVFCDTDVDHNDVALEFHKKSQIHIKMMADSPYSEDFGINLIRMLKNGNAYCTICNVLVTPQYFQRHISNEVHQHELEKAMLKALTYKPLT